jgi:hypothetical protein
MQIRLLVVVATLLTGCNDSTNTSPSLATATPPATQIDDLSLSKLLGEISERVQGASGGVQQALGPHGEVLQDLTKDEMEKLFRWEYRVVDVEGLETAPDFENRLTELGTEGWECFSIAQSTNATRITCKRRPRSALGYLKLIPGL